MYHIIIELYVLYRKDRVVLGVLFDLTFVKIQCIDQYTYNLFFDIACIMSKCKMVKLVSTYITIANISLPYTFCVHL